MTLRVALVCQNVVRQDGQGRAMLELARALASRGHDVSVHAHSLDEEMAGRVRFHRIPRFPGAQLLDDLFLLAWASLGVRRRRPDVVCALGPTVFTRRPFVFYAQFSHRGWRRTWTAASRPGPYHVLHARIIEALEAWCARRACRVIATTAALGEQVGAAPERLVVVPNATDLAEFAPADSGRKASARGRFGLAPDAFVLGFVGGYTTSRKGLEPLLRAVASVEDAELIVAGRGPEARLRERARELSIGGRVRAAGFVAPQDVYAASDVVVVPSLYEPFSLVALESAASGVPIVIAASAGAAPLLDGSSVTVTDPTDPAELAAAIASLRDPAERALRAHAGRQVAQNFGWNDVFDKAADVVEQAGGRR